MKLTFSQEKQLKGDFSRYQVMCNGIPCGGFIASINTSRVCILEYGLEIHPKDVFRAYAQQMQIPVYIKFHPLEMVGTAERMGLVEASPEEVDTTIWCHDDTERQVFRIKT